MVPPSGMDRLTVVTGDARLRVLDPGDFTHPVEPVGRVRVPGKISYRNPRARRDLAATVRAQVPDLPPGAARSRRVPASPPDSAGPQERISALRKQIRAHPCHGCPDREHHARWAERWRRLERETRRLRSRAEGRSSSIARTFDRTCALLDELGYLRDDGTRVSPDGHRLARVYSERDLLTAQCLRAGVWRGLGPAGLAAAVSCLVNEPRGEERESSPLAGGARLAGAHDAMVRLWSELDNAEEAHDLPRTPYPDPGIAHLVHVWARGRGLDAVLAETELAAGDFVRRCKQVADLLDQIVQVAPSPELSATARAAVDAVVRGVVAADRLD